MLGDKGVLKHEAGKLTLSVGTGNPLRWSRRPASPPKAPRSRCIANSSRMYATESIRRLRPEVALEPAKIAYAAEMSIAEHRTVTAKDFA